MMGKILVTGATGNIGSFVVKELVQLGCSVKAAVRNMKKDNFPNPLVEAVIFDFTDPSTFPHALSGVDKLFLVRPPQLANPAKDMKPFLSAVKEKGIKHIVFVSLMGVEKNPVVPHRKIENMIIEFNLPYTFLRPSFFMQNLNTTHLDDIKLRDELYMPVGKAKTSFIDTRDIAAAAAVCLTGKGHIGKAYTLTGNEALDYYEVENILTDVLQRKIRYKKPNAWNFRRTIIKRGIDVKFANVMTMLYLATSFGTAAKVTTDTMQLLGRQPISFRKYAEDHKEMWTNIS